MVSLKRFVRYAVVVLMTAPIVLGLKTAASVKFDSGRLFDKYPNLLFKKERKHLDNLAAQLKKEPGSKGYIVVYEGSEDHVTNLKARTCRALDHLVLNSRLEPGSVVGMVITGGHRKKFTVELWMWPRESPDDLPRFQFGVSENEIELVKGVDIARSCGPKRGS